MRKRPVLATCIGLGLTVTTSAADADNPPSSRDTRQVVGYYYSDGTQPVLMDFRLCRGIHDDGADPVRLYSRTIRID